MKFATKIKITIKNHDLKTSLEREVDAVYDSSKIIGVLGIEDGTKALLQFVNGTQVECIEPFSEVTAKWQP